MARRNPREVLERFVELTNQRAWKRLDEVLHPGYVEEYPQSGERTVGIANAVAAREQYPVRLALGELGGFELVGANDVSAANPARTVVRITGTSDHYTFVLRTLYPDGSDWFTIGLAEFEDGLISRTTVFSASGHRTARLAGAIS
jgi:hypothetical protein